MTQSKLQRMDRLGIALWLCVACSGKVHDIGNDAAAGGRGGLGSGGTSSTPAYGAGNRALEQLGGAAGFGASSPTVAPQGGYLGEGIGGVAGGDYEFRLNARKPYVEVPSLPIDPSCSCADTSKICNAARQCVDRCDKDGRCALWLTEHAVNDLFVEDSTVYYLQSPTTDPLGNKAKNAALYRVDYPDGKPQPIASGLADAYGILGRYAGATYLITSGDWAYSSITRISDVGSVEQMNACNMAHLLGKWLAFISDDGGRVSLLDLDADPSSPRVVVDLKSTGKLALQVSVLDDYLWYLVNVPGESGGSYKEVCYLEKAQLDLAPICQRPTWATTMVATTGGNSIFNGPGQLASYDVKGQYLLNLTNGTGDPEYTTYKEGWLYSMTSADPVRLVRCPTTVGRLPQDVLPANIASPAYAAAGPARLGYAISSDAIYWFQSAQDRNQGQYIFRAPLPPLPCDAELACPSSGSSCSNGLCIVPR